jgi:transposase
MWPEDDAYGPPTGGDRKKGGRDRCVGRSRGGLTTKIHALVDAQGRPIQLKLTAGQASDIASAADMIGHLAPGSMLMADKGYDANALRALVGERGAWANIPPKSNVRIRGRPRDRSLRASVAGSMMRLVEVQAAC